MVELKMDIGGALRVVGAILGLSVAFSLPARWRECGRVPPPGSQP